MNELFTLKEWLTVTEAARYLSIVFEEAVAEADVLRLGLDGHLCLSVYVVNHAEARCGRVVAWEETDWVLAPRLRETLVRPAMNRTDQSKDTRLRPCPPKLRALLDEVPPEKREDFSPLMLSLKIDGERFVTLSDSVTTLEGVWDLPMIGSERLDIEDRWQRLTDGPRVTLHCLDGTFVEGRDGQICQLHDRFDDDLARAESRPAKEKYYPMARLPNDAVLVVRTEALRKFEKSTADAVPPASHAHVSDKLAKMNQASTRFWAEAVRGERDTHPDNATVAAWLEKNGFSPTLADKAATIIRPDWAPRGRKPEE